MGATDNTGVCHVVVAYTDRQGAWQSVDLAPAGGDTWQGTLELTSSIEYFVQVVDEAGYVSIDDNDGSYHTASTSAGPEVPQLLFPPDNTVTATQAITFTWAPTTTGTIPTGYNLELDGAVVTTTSTIWPTILSADIHTWAVRAFNAGGYSDWTNAWTVEVIGHRIYLPLVVRNNSTR